MGLPETKPASYEDLFDLPENLVGEIINGRLVTHPRPAPRHARAYSGIGGNLFDPFDRGRGGPGGWWILDEPELHIGGHILVPDLAGWRRERMQTLPDTAWFEMVPDWVCEVLSPGTAKIDRVEKMPIYAAIGAQYAWLVDPDLRTLEACQNQDGRWLLIGVFKEADPVQVAPFDAVPFDLAALWPD
jgi:Uma2 family endonuclease